MFSIFEATFWCPNKLQEVHPAYDQAQIPRRVGERHPQGIPPAQVKKKQGIQILWDLADFSKVLDPQVFEYRDLEKS